MNQMTFSDMEYSGRKRVTQKEKFLREMNNIMDSEDWGYEPDEDEEEYYKILAELEDTFGDLIRKEEKKLPEGKVIQMFGEKKGKKK